MFVHVVFFWLKPDAPAGAREQLKSDCERTSARSPPSGTSGPAAPR